MTQQEEITIIYNQLSKDGWNLTSICPTDKPSFYYIKGMKFGFGLIKTPWLVEVKDNEVYFIFTNLEMDWNLKGTDGNNN